MTKSELMVRLAEVFAEKNGNQLLAKDVEYSVKVLVDTMTRSLARGQRIEIRGFGSFDLNHRPARIGRNPKTGERVEVPEKHVPHFKPGKELRERVDLALQESAHDSKTPDSGGQRAMVFFFCFRKKYKASFYHIYLNRTLFQLYLLQCFCKKRRPSEIIYNRPTIL